MAVTLHTNFGDLKLELHCDLTPLACENFLALCASGYYDNTKFHRNIKGYIIQGGDPEGTGKGGNSIWGEKFKDEFVSSLKHDTKGVVSYANSGADTNASQFFITYQKHPHLDNKYTVFARVISGLDVLNSLEKVPVDKKSVPTQPIILKSVTIHSNPIADSM